MKSRIFVLIFPVILFLIIPSSIAQDQPDLHDPIGLTVFEERQEIAPGIVHLHRRTDDPLNIHILVVDVTQPGVSLRPCLAQDHATGLETVRSMATRTGAIAAVNGDYWTHGGTPLSLVVIDGEIIIAPKYRTTFGIQWDGKPVIGMWTGGWSWQAQVIAPNSTRHDIVMMNSDSNPDWLCLYSDKYGRPTRGNTVSPVTEVIFNLERRVLEVRKDLPGREIPSGGFVLTGRDSAGKWLEENFKQGDLATFDLRSDPPWQQLRHAIGAGPRILKAGQFYQDSVVEFPAGEEFTLDWKRGHYFNRYPRTALGVSEKADKVILVTVDGRQPEFSIGVYQKQMADLLVEFGAWDGMDLDSGGSTTMVIRGKVVNHPSDRAQPDGTGGRERSVANALLVFYEGDT